MKRTYNYNVWFENEESTDSRKSDLPPIPPLEGDKEEKVKDGKGLKILTAIKPLIRVPIILAQIKAGNN